MKKVLVIMAIFSLVAGFVFSNTAELTLLGEIAQNLQIRIASPGSSDWGTERSFNVDFTLDTRQRAADLREIANVPFTVKAVFTNDGSGNFGRLRHVEEYDAADTDTYVAYTVFYNDVEKTPGEEVVMNSVGSFGDLHVHHLGTGLVQEFDIKLDAAFAGLAGNYEDTIEFQITAP